MGTCTVCGSGATETAFTKNGVEYRRCDACECLFSFNSGNPNLENRIGDFEDAYLQYLSPDEADGINFTRLFRWMRRFCELRQARLLDVGCGSGKLVRYFRTQGVKARGVEPSPALFDRFLQDDSGFYRSVPDAVADGGHYDIVTVFDVIEHVRDPRLFLREVSDAVRPGGHVFISTPDLGSVAARLSGRHWHFIHRYHLSYFKRDALTRLAAECGLQALDARTRIRFRSLSYVARYACDFLLRRRAPHWVCHLDGWYVPADLLDVMSVSFRRGA